MSKILIDEATVNLVLEALESMAKTLDEHGETTTFNEDQAMAALKSLAKQPAQTAGKSELETVPAKGGLLAEQPAQQEQVGRLESDPDEGHVFVPRIKGDWSMLGKDLYTTPQAPKENQS